MELVERFRNGLINWGEFTEVLLNALSLLAIVIGLAMSLRSIQYRKSVPGKHPLHTLFRRNFGGWLVVALEFQLAADIVGTIIAPTGEHLIELGAIAVIRTFLNYFLGKELKEETERLKEVKQ